MVRDEIICHAFIKQGKMQFDRSGTSLFITKDILVPEFGPKVTNRN